MALTTSTTITKEDKNDNLKDQSKLNLDNKDETFDPVANFLIASKAPETKRQYPKRREVFFNFLKLEGSLEEKSLVFYHQVLENPKWLSFQLIRFLQFQKERVSKGEIVESTISNYFKAIRLFCEMNEIDVN